MSATPEDNSPGASAEQVPPHPLDKRWHVHIDKKTYGPFTGQYIRRMVEERKFIDSVLVYPEGGSAWVRAGDDPILGSLFKNYETIEAPRLRPPSRVKPLQRNWMAILIGAFVVLIVGWMAWPYYAVYELMIATRDGDVSVLENRVEWDSVRQALRGELNALTLAKIQKDTNTKDSDKAFAGLAVMLGPAITNQMVDGYITPQAIAAMRRAETSATKGTDSAANPPSIPDLREIRWNQIQYAFFSGGPLTFKVDFIPKFDPPGQTPITLVFKWIGTWKLTRIQLPTDTIERLTLPDSRKINTPNNSSVTAAKQPVEASKENVSLKKKQDYFKNLEIYDFKARYYKSVLDGRIPGVEFKIKNNGTETLEMVKVTVYFKDTQGSTIAENDYTPVLVSTFSFSNDKPLKPNYIWQLERGKFYSAKSVPAEWKEGAAEIRITDLRFEGESKHD